MLRKSVSYDPGYDNRNWALIAVSCSDGANGLITRFNWNTQGQIPNFPCIGGFQDIAGGFLLRYVRALHFTAYSDTSIQCGTCYFITYNGKTIHILAIDHTDRGFNIAEQAINDLTGGHAVQYGRVHAQYVQVDISNCTV